MCRFYWLLYSKIKKKKKQINNKKGNIIKRKKKKKGRLVVFEVYFVESISKLGKNKNFSKKKHKRRGSRWVKFSNKSNLSCNP